MSIHALNIFYSLCFPSLVTSFVHWTIQKHRFCKVQQTTDAVCQPRPRTTKLYFVGLVTSKSHTAQHTKHTELCMFVCVSCECVVRCGWRVVYCWTFKDDFINSRVAKVLESAECLWRWWIYTHPVNFRFVMHKLLRGVKNRIKRVTRQFNLLCFTSVNLVVRS